MHIFSPKKRKKSLPTHPPLLSMGRPKANKDIFKSGLIPLLSIINNQNRVGFGFMLFKASFNNISAILWRSVLLVEETEVPGENHRPLTSH
jgi:hypothetical protein